MWVVGSLAQYGKRILVGYACAAIDWLAWSVWRTVNTGEPLDLFPLAFWLVGSVLVYVYLVLSGVVASRVGREQAGEPGRGDGERNHTN